MAGLVFVLLDGLNAQTADDCMSCLRALTTANILRRATLRAELPPLSRPLYVTLFSGLKPVESGILHNNGHDACPGPTIFQRASEAGLTTAAAAYAWVSELCNGRPFVPARDRITADPALPIAYGLFYSDDAYPDAELFRDAEALRHGHAPRLLLVHSMGIDCAGHAQGAHSLAYRQAARQADALLAAHLPLWLGDGYRVLVTSDHGMAGDGSHYDDSDEARCVPLWLGGAGTADMPLPRAQTQVAALAVRLLDMHMPSCRQAQGS